jgi:hypothetical protein
MMLKNSNIISVLKKDEKKMLELINYWKILWLISFLLNIYSSNKGWRNLKILRGIKGFYFLKGYILNYD